MKTKRPFFIIATTLLALLACQTLSGAPTAQPAIVIVSTASLAPDSSTDFHATSEPLSSEPNCDTGVVIESRDTPQGDFLDVCAFGLMNEVGPLAKGMYAVAPSNVFFVYCSNRGEVYAVRIGNRNLQKIGNAKKFFAIRNGQIPQFEFEFTGDHPYMEITVREASSAEKFTFPIPKHISEP